MADLNDLIANGIRPPQVDDPTTNYGKLLAIQGNREQLNAARLENQARQLQIQQAQRDAADQEILRSAYMNSNGDFARYQENAMKAGASPKAIMAIQTQGLALKKSYADMDKVTLENDEKRHDALRGELTSFLTQDPATKASTWQPWIQQHIANGRLTQQEGAQLLGQFPQYPGDDHMKLYANGLATGSQFAKEENERRTAAAREMTANTGKARLDAELPGINADAMQKQVAALAPQLEAAFKAGGPQAAAALLDQQPHGVAKRFMGAQKPGDFLAAALTPDQARQGNQAQATADETKRYHDAEIANAAKRLGLEGTRLFMDREETKLSPEATDKMAEMFAVTGQLPTMGNGRNAAAVRSQVINRAAEKFPEVQFATNKAAFQANAASLKKAQANLDAVDAAEKTADKNLQVFLDQAKKVIDTGSPYLNKPLRELDDQLLGNPEMAAFRAARNTAIAEIGRVLNNPNGAAAISDSARHEIEGLTKPDATLPQIAAAAKILRTDMRNRHESYSQQIDAITQRIGGETNTGGPKPPKIGDVVDGYVFMGGEPSDKNNWKPK